MTDSRMLAEAIRLAADVHVNAMDKAGRPYIEHPFGVAARLDDDRAKTVAMLHDVVEDTDVTAAQLREKFPAEVVDAVVAITRNKGEGDEYYERVRANPLALRVKLADIADNLDPVRLAKLEPDDRSRLTRKYEHALSVLTG